MVGRIGTAALVCGVLIAGLSWATPVEPCSADDGPAEGVAQAVELSFKTYRTFDLQLPAEQWHPVAAGFALPQAPDGRFRAELDGTALAIDTNC